MTFASGLDSLARRAPSRRCMKALSPRTGLLATYSPIELYSLAVEAEYVPMVLEAAFSPNIRQSATPSKVFLPCSLGSGVTSSCNEASKDCGASGWFPTACSALNPAMSQQLSRRICSRLLTTVAPSPHLRRGFVILELRLVKKMKEINRRACWAWKKWNCWKEAIDSKDYTSSDQFFGRAVLKVRRSYTCHWQTKSDRFIQR